LDKVFAKVGIAVIRALQHRTLEAVGDRQGQVATESEGLRELGELSIDPKIRKDEDTWELCFRGRECIEQVVYRFSRIFGIDQGCAKRSEGIGPDANDRGADGKAGLFDRERHQQTHAASGVNLVPYDRDANLAVLKTRHCRGQETCGKEYVRLHGPVRKKVELFLQVIAHAPRING